MCKNNFFSLIFLSLIAISLMCISHADAQTITVSGTVYTDEGITPMADGSTVRIKANGAGDYSDLLDSGDGTYLINNITAGPKTTLTVFLDSDPYDPNAEKGTTLYYRIDGSDINNLDIYENHIIIRGGSFLTIADMTTYDYDQDPDILFDAETGATDTLKADPGNLFPAPDTVFYIWPGCLFLPKSGNATVTLDNIKISATGQYYADYSCPTTYVSGSWTNEGTYVWGVHTACDSVIFNASSGTRDIISGGSAFRNLTFNDGGGGATWELEDLLRVHNNLTITSGTLDANAAENNGIFVEGSWTNSGTFLPRAGFVLFNDDQPNTHTITSGGSSFSTFVIGIAAGGKYTLEDALDVDEWLYLMKGTLDTDSSENNSITVGGDWLKSTPSTFNVNSSTVTFDGTGAQSVTTDNGNWHEIKVTNPSAAGVTFLDGFTSAALTCTTPDAHLNFKSGETFEVTASGGLDLQGADSQPVVLSRYLGNPGDRWTINPSGGSWTVSYVDVKDSSNSEAFYIKPSDSIDSGNNYNWFSQEACITQITPSSPSIDTGGTIQFYSSNGGGCSQTPAYNWSVTSGIGSNINENGLYMAGTNNTGNTLEEDVTVNDTANSVTDTVTVCVGDAGCSVALSPSSKTLASGDTIQFSAANTGCTQGTLTWELTSSIGSTINASGLYTAGTNSGARTFVDTVTLTDTSNCVLDTAAVTIPGYTPPERTTTVPAVTTTTTTSIPTPTTTSTISATTTTTVPCTLRITPQSTAVTQGETISFKVTSTGNCTTHEYEWSLSSNTDSSIEANGTSCIYTAGKNDTSDPLTDTIIVEDIANGTITATATVTLNSAEEVVSLTALPGSLVKTLFLPYPAWLSLEGTGTHFDQFNSVITLDPPTAVWPLFTLVTDNTTILSLILVMPAWFAGSDNEPVTITVTTGDLAVSATLDIEFVPSMLGE